MRLYMTLYLKLLVITGSWLFPVCLFPQAASLILREGKILYQQDSLGNRVLDFSHCGYMQSEEGIPDIPNTIFVPCVEGDATGMIRRAIRYVEQLPVNEAGFRGAVLLDKGIYRLSGSLFISKPGVVLRGSGQNETILRKTGVAREAFIHVEGTDDMIITDTIPVVSDYIPVNLRSLDVGDVFRLQGVENIVIWRPSTKEWIEKLGCDHFGGGITYLGWKPGEMDIRWDRKIVKINGNTIEIDAPLTTALDGSEADTRILVYSWPGRISRVGIENLTIESDYDRSNPKDEDHCWTGISVDHATDCWIRQVGFRHLAGSAVILQPGSSRVTVEDCISEEPISEIGGMRRNTFLTLGQLNLFQRCYSEEGIHDFGAGYLAAGPNAFVQCETENSLGYSGATDSWAGGLLFDIVNIDGNDLSFKNIGQDNNGGGWTTGNSLFWQCTAAGIFCYSPDASNMNRAYGCWGQFSGDGEWNESNNHVVPVSLFYAQLSDRLGGDFSERAGLLPLSRSATSSPTVEEALALTAEASQPRLTLKQWIRERTDDIVSHDPGLLSVLQLKREADSAMPVADTTIAIVNGKISFRNRLLTGKATGVSWWSGKLRTTQISRATPHITRFVPGREGTGLTDRIDSVVASMKRSGITVLDHNYGLWYDRRRDDHQRVKRKDGDVWGPFYEQPFARSGTAYAWDGLSKYDLTKPNRWYWSRLQEFARKGSTKGILLFHQHYFQHNIIEAGAHWVDTPWRSANNVNDTGFPEPVPFAGDKRIFMSELFYDVNQEQRRELHRNYIRQCLNALAEEENVVHLTSAEYTGPLHFVEFWLDVIAEWKLETGKDPLIALSTTKDVQDAILNDPVRSEIVDVIDIRYWHYQDGGLLYAPEGGKHLAPRQFARKMKMGAVSFEDVYKAVSEYRQKQPAKAVTYYAPKYPEMAWAVFMAGGSLPGLPPIDDDSFLKDALQMQIMDDGRSPVAYQALEKTDIGKIIYFRKGSDRCPITLPPGMYQVKKIDTATGKITLLDERFEADRPYDVRFPRVNDLYWFKRKL